MIFISMQGADGSSSAFVNNIHTEFAKPRKNGSKKTKKKKKLTNGEMHAVSFLL